MTTVDYRHSRAVLVGVWSYRDRYLPDVPAARTSLESMRSLLSSDLCGWPAESITVLADPATAADVPDQLMQAYAEASDVALFYFVGHGQVDEDDELCLCVSHSVTAAPRRGTTSLVYSAVRNALLRSPARVKIVILDCCYSGVAAEHSASLSSESADLAELARASGVYTMTASGPYSKAWTETTEADGPDAQTIFTKHFVDVIRRGIAGQPPSLRLGPIFHAVHDDLRSADLPVPTRRTSHTADDFVFARNRWIAAPQPDPVAEIAELRGKLTRMEAELARLLAPGTSEADVPPPAPETGSVQIEATDDPAEKDLLIQAIEAVDRQVNQVIEVREHAAEPVRGAGRSDGVRLRRLSIVAAVLTLLVGSAVYAADLNAGTKPGKPAPTGPVTGPVTRPATVEPRYDGDVDLFEHDVLSFGSTGVIRGGDEAGSDLFVSTPSYKGAKTALFLTGLKEFVVSTTTLDQCRHRTYTVAALPLDAPFSSIEIDDQDRTVCYRPFDSGVHVLLRVQPDDSGRRHFRVRYSSVDTTP